MKNYKIAILFVAILIGGSCKQRQKTLQGGEKNTTRNIRNDVNKNQMTASRAKEEETFVQGCIEKSLGNSRKALIQFQECLKINPQSAATNFEIAGIYREFEQTDRALLFAKKAFEFAPTNRWYVLRYAELLQENKMNIPAIVVFKNLSDKESNNVDLLFRYANSLARAEKFDEALKKYNEIEIIEGVSDTLQMCRIEIYKKQLNIIGEEKALTALTNAFPRNIDYAKLLADFYYTTDQSEKAILVFKKMIVSYPNSAVPHLLLAGYYNKIKDDENALKEAQYGFLISEESSLSLKINVLAELCPINDSAAAHSRIKNKIADSLCAILMRVHQNKPEPFIASGNYQFKRGKMAEARDMYFKAIDRGQIDYSTWEKIMAVYNNLNDPETQTKICMTILELFPSQPAPYYYLGLIQLNKKKYADAIKNLEVANDFLNENKIDELKITTALIDAYRGDGKNIKADEYSEKIITTDTNNYNLIKSYSTSLSDRETNLFRAEKLMLMLVKHDTSNVSNLKLLGKIEYQIHDYRAANKYLLLALAQLPNDAQLYELLGDNKFRLGSADEALVYWKQAKEKGEKSAILEQKINTKLLNEAK